MGLTIINIAKSFCYEDKLTAPSSLVSSTDPNAQQLLYLILAVGRELLREKCWVQLKRTHSFSTVDGDDAYALPTDFYCPIHETYWDTTNKRRLVGGMTDQTYDEYLYGYAVGPVSSIYFRIFGRLGTDQFQVQPTPDSTILALKFDYMSNAWVLKASDSSWQSTIAADADTTAFDDDLMIQGLRWMWKKANKMDYQDDESLWREKITAIQTNLMPATVIDIGQRHGGPQLLSERNYPEGSF